MFPDPGGICAYRPVRDANCAQFQFARLHSWEDGQVVGQWGTEPRIGDLKPLTVDLVERDSNGERLQPARMPYLDSGTLLLCGMEAIEAAAPILEPFGELLQARTSTGRSDLAVFHAFGLVEWGDGYEHLNETSHGTYLYLSPKNANDIRTLGAFRHVIDPQGAMFVSDELVMKLGRAGLIDGTSFRICAPRIDSCG